MIDLSTLHRATRPRSPRRRRRPEPARSNPGPRARPDTLPRHGALAFRSGPVGGGGTARQPESPGTGAIPVGARRSGCRVPRTIPDTPRIRQVTRPERQGPIPTTTATKTTTNPTRTTQDRDIGARNRTTPTTRDESAACGALATSPRGRKEQHPRPDLQPVDPSTADGDAVPDSGSEPARFGRDRPRADQGSRRAGAPVPTTPARPSGPGSSTGRSVPTDLDPHRHPTDHRCAKHRRPGKDRPRKADLAAQAPGPIRRPTRRPQTSRPRPTWSTWAIGTRPCPPAPAGDPDTVQPAELAGYSSTDPPAERGPPRRGLHCSGLMV